MAVGEQERLARVTLNRLAEPGDLRMTRLVADLGAIVVRDHLLAERGLSTLHDDVAARLDTIDPARELEAADKVGIRFVVPGDEEWPSGLDALSEAGTVNDRGGVPIGLWVRGPLRLPDHREAVAVVGARTATTYGARVAADLGADLAASGRAVVSGAALGIDQSAHRGALAVEGRTVAVLACGVDRVYPAANRSLLEYVREVGAVVSEAPLGGAPMRIRFLSRNRLIAALAGGTVVVEAALRSGALSSAAWAERLGRVVMGVPGPVTSAQSQGVHERLRTGGAHLVTCAEDVVELLAEAGEDLLDDRREAVTERDRLTLRQRQVLDAVGVSTARRADRIAAVAGVGLREVQSALGTLEAKGWVRQDGDAWVLGRTTVP
ncbi:putative DNA processing protein DprA [Nocardioides daphniae]|uniref:DNA processing protein DprA n=1 Tax=Nocardioides daphniae TaxID=402297 RepID=A0ABQ1Q8M3_9ACTN|nr:putative DNA processing protein DprA [Nocardioides daphniae]